MVGDTESQPEPKEDAHEGERKEIVFSGEKKMCSGSENSSDSLIFIGKLEGKKEEDDPRGLGDSYESTDAIEHSHEKRLRDK